jgi:hypothetical protein
MQRDVTTGHRLGKRVTAAPSLFVQPCLLIFSYFTTVSNPFALSLSKGLQRACPEFAEGLRQAQPERCHVLRKHQ